MIGLFGWSNSATGCDQIEMNHIRWGGRKLNYNDSAALNVD